MRAGEYVAQARRFNKEFAAGPYWRFTHRLAATRASAAEAI
jgi:hypothetical protein